MGAEWTGMVTSYKGVVGDIRSIGGMEAYGMREQSCQRVIGNERRIRERMSGIGIHVGIFEV